MEMVTVSTTPLIAADLYEAARSGSVASLDSLLNKYGEAIIDRVSLTSLDETPLHVAARRGHLEFSRRLLELKPELAAEQDSERCTPLHLAAANGHVHVVRELLKAYETASLVRDHEGRVPLHLAAMRGRLPVVMELLKSRHAREAVKMQADDGNGVLHLCVKYTHLEVLKGVLDSIGDMNDEIMKMTNSHGNTVLQLAVTLKQKEAVRFLVELPGVKADVINAMKVMGLTALGVTKNLREDSKSKEIRTILVAGLKEGAAPEPEPGLARPTTLVGAETVHAGSSSLSKWEKVWYHLKRLMMGHNADWMSETKGSLMMVATIVATVSFQAVFAPPGGVWQEDTTESKSDNNATCNSTNVCLAGRAVLASYLGDRFLVFMQFNTTCFVMSLIVVLLLVSGFPLDNKFCLWILSIFMCVAVSFFGLTFIYGLYLVIPQELDADSQIKLISYYVWLVVIIFVAAGLVLRLSNWLDRIRPDKDFWKKLYGNPRVLTGKCDE